MTTTIDVKFDDNEHRYWQDDQEIPGVNRVLRQAGFVDESYFTEEIADRGKVVHECVKLINRRELDWRTVAEEVEPYVASYAAWFSDMATTMQILSTEEIIFDPTLWYAGTLDFTCVFGTHKKTLRYYIVEVKTGWGAPWHRLQLAAYKLAKKPPRGKYWHSAFLYLPSNGAPAEWIEPPYPTHDREVFEQALSCFNWRLTNGDRTCFNDRTIEHVSDYQGSREVLREGNRRTPTT